MDQDPSLWAAFIAWMASHHPQIYAFGLSVAIAVFRVVYGKGGWRQMVLEGALCGLATLTLVPLLAYLGLPDCYGHLCRWCSRVHWRREAPRVRRPAHWPEDRQGVIMATDHELDILAKTLWGEARGEGREGLIAVAWVIKNRADNPGWWGKSIELVCLKPYQFSCWNADDPNAPYLRGRKLIPPREYMRCREAAVAVLEGHEPDRRWAPRTTTRPA